MSDDAVIVAPEIKPFPFEPGPIMDSVNEVLSRIPEDHNGAVLAVVNRESIGLCVAARLGDNWSFVGMLNKPYHKALQAQAALTLSF